MTGKEKEEELKLSIAKFISKITMTEIVVDFLVGREYCILAAIEKGNLTREESENVINEVTEKLFKEITPQVEKRISGKEGFKNPIIVGASLNSK